MNMTSKLPQGSTNGAVAEEMKKIRKKATQLDFLLKQAFPENLEIGVIVEQIFGFASRSLSTMENSETPSSGNQRSIEFSSKRRKMRPSGNRRGGFGTRTVTATTLDDGHIWRKYGQKIIHGAKHPRSYFRCIHRHDQGCMAIKQVQKSENNSSNFIITYFGEHTCRDPAITAHQMLPTSCYKDSHLINFQSSNEVNISSSRPAGNIVVPCKFRSTHQEPDHEELSNLTTGNSLSADYKFVIPEANYQSGTVMPQEHIVDHGDNFDIDFNDFLLDNFGSDDLWS